VKFEAFHRCFLETAKMRGGGRIEMPINMIGRYGCSQFIIRVNFSPDAMQFSINAPEVCPVIAIHVR
jgi:hypothetical protein